MTGKVGRFLPATRKPPGDALLPVRPSPAGPPSPAHCTYRPWGTGLGSQPGEWSLEVERRLEGRPLLARPPARPPRS